MNTDFTGGVALLASELFLFKWSRRFLLADSVALERESTRKLCRISATETTSATKKLLLTYRRFCSGNRAIVPSETSIEFTVAW